MLMDLKYKFMTGEEGQAALHMLKVHVQVQINSASYMQPRHSYFPTCLKNCCCVHGCNAHIHKTVTV